MGLAKSSAAVPDGYYDAYYDNVRAAVKSKKGVLDDRHYTEYARVSMALCAIEKDPQEVEGYNLLQPLDNYTAVTQQGINGIIFALIAADVCGYELKEEERYLKTLIDMELEGGGFALEGEGKADADITAMALQALSIYKDDKAARQAAERAVKVLSSLQQEDGGFGTSSESISQVIMGLAAAGVDLQDAQFTKGENSLFDSLMMFWTGNGFCHQQGEEADLMATEQAMCALDALAGDW